MIAYVLPSRHPGTAGCGLARRASDPEVSLSRYTAVTRTISIVATPVPRTHMGLNSMRYLVPILRDHRRAGGQPDLHDAPHLTRARRDDGWCQVPVPYGARELGHVR
jgi:hypothetical protein